MASPILKGFLIGSSFGVFSALFGITQSLSRGILLGSAMGILAGLTIHYKLKKKKDEDNKE